MRDLIFEEMMDLRDGVKGPSPGEDNIKLLASGFE